MSGYNWMGYAERALNAGVVDYVDGDGNLMRGAAMVPGFAQDAADLAQLIVMGSVLDGFDGIGDGPESAENERGGVQGGGGSVPGGESGGGGSGGH